MYQYQLFMAKTHEGARRFWRSLIDDAIFVFNDKASEDVAEQECKQHVAAILQTQDGETYRELSLADRRALFAQNNPSN